MESTAAAKRQSNGEHCYQFQPEPATELRNRQMRQRALPAVLEEGFRALTNQRSCPWRAARRVVGDTDEDQRAHKTKRLFRQVIEPAADQGHGRPAGRALLALSRLSARFETYPLQKMKNVCAQIYRQA
jgi:hypothetical protein